MIIFSTGRAERVCLRPGYSLIGMIPYPWVIADNEDEAEVVVSFADGMAEGVDPAVAEYLCAAGLADRNVRRFAAALILRGARQGAR